MMMAIFRYLPFREAVKKIEPFLLKIFGTFTVKITFCVPNLSLFPGVGVWVKKFGTIPNKIVSLWLIIVLTFLRFSRHIPIYLSFHFHFFCIPQRHGPRAMAPHLPPLLATDLALYSPNTWDLELPLPLVGISCTPWVPSYPCTSTCTACTCIVLCFNEKVLITETYLYLCLY